MQLLARSLCSAWIHTKRLRGILQMLLLLACAPLAGAQQKGQPVGTACQAPAGLTASLITAATADISWAAAPNALWYEYQLDQSAADPAGQGTVISALNKLLTGLNNGTTYFFHLRAVCPGNDFSAWVQTSFTTATTGSCTAPALLTATNIGPVAATLSWNAVPGSTGYEYAVQHGSAAPLTGQPAAGTQAVVSGLSSGSPYYAFVRTRCSNLFSAWVSHSFFTHFPVGIASQQAEEPEWQVYPNPAAEQLHIAGGTGRVVSMTLTDMQGRELGCWQNMQVPALLDLSGLGPGAYILRIRQDGQVYSRLLTRL